MNTVNNENIFIIFLHCLLKRQKTEIQKIFFNETYILKLVKMLFTNENLRDYKEE